MPKLKSITGATYITPFPPSIQSTYTQLLCTTPRARLAQINQYNHAAKFSSRERMIDPSRTFPQQRGWPGTRKVPHIYIYTIAWEIDGGEV